MVDGLPDADGSGKFPDKGVLLHIRTIHTAVLLVHRHEREASIIVIIYSINVTGQTVYSGNDIRSGPSDWAVSPASATIQFLPLQPIIFCRYLLLCDDTAHRSLHLERVPCSLTQISSL